MKLHIGCGSVYLSPAEGWRNVDIRGPKTFLAADRPDLVKRWITRDRDYYARHKETSIETLRQGPLEQEYVCDAFGSFDNIPAQYWEAEEVLARHSFEHLSITEAHRALDQIDAVLKTNGLLRLDVPDHEETLRLFKATGDEFYVRHLLGPRRNNHGFHMMSYTRDRLRALVEDHGFVFIKEEPNIHFYPAFTLRFVKPGPRAPRDYVPLPDLPKDWQVADVGPGDYPLPRADVYIDWNINRLAPLSRQGKSTILGDIEKGLPEIRDKAFDFVWASHCFEHFERPDAAAATLSRIAKSGMIVVPSTFKEMMFFGEEREHLWQCLPSPTTGGVPIFIRSNGCYMAGLRDAGMQKIASRLYRTGPNRQEEGRYLRKWFYENEHKLDIVYAWEGELRLEVIQ